MSHPRKNLTLKQKQFCKRYLDLNGNATQAALEVYNASYSSSKVIAYQNLQKPQIQAHLKSLLDIAGLSDKEIAFNLKSIIQEGVESGTAQAQDAVKAIELVAKLKDLFPSKKVELDSRSLLININATTSELLKQLKEVTEENQKLIDEIHLSKN